jgi:hypothetical protein
MDANYMESRIASASLNSMARQLHPHDNEQKEWLSDRLPGSVHNTFIVGGRTLRIFKFRSARSFNYALIPAEL